MMTVTNFQTRGLASMCVLALLAAPAFSEVKLEHKRQPGTSHKVQTITKIDQTLSILGMDTVTGAETIATSTITDGPRGEDGKIKSTEKVTALQVSIKAGGNEYMFDSANPDKTGSSQVEFLRGLHKAMINSETIRVFDKDGRIESIEMDQKALESLPEQAKTLVAGQFDSDQLMKTANDQLDVIPDEAIEKGDTWERNSTANFGAGQIMTFKTRYTYEGTVEKDGKTLHKIASKTLSVEFALAGDSPLPLTVKGSELKTEDDSGGTLLFDRELGQVVEGKGSVHITGSIAFEANGMDLPATLDLKMANKNTRQQ